MAFIAEAATESSAVAEAPVSLEQEVVTADVSEVAADGSQGAAGGPQVAADGVQGTSGSSRDTWQTEL